MQKADDKSDKRMKRGDKDLPMPIAEISISEKPALRTRAGALPRPPGLLGLGQKTQFGG